MTIPSANLLDRMAFTGEWRDYQARVLAALDELITDDRVHVIAAPGSGKTVLGLEIMRRLGRPALILAPTATIRDQWRARLHPLFLPAPPVAADVSCDLDMIGAMTVATYQALHARWNEADEDVGESESATNARPRFDALLAALRAAGPVTLIVDEAHHLRRAWWSALHELTAALPDLRLVALTATPPYDAAFAEWTHYEALCGPVDAEISVPELVRNGELCPHQDHVLFSLPDEDIVALLDRRRRAIADLVARLRGDVAFRRLFEEHGWLCEPALHDEQILDAPEMLSAILVFLASCGRPLPRAPLALLGVARDELPMPSAFWLELLLDGLLFRFRDIFPLGDTVPWLRATLHEYGLIEGGHVRLRENREIFALMAGCIAKLDSIADIVRREAEDLGDALRMVILTDHIRAGDLPRATDAAFRPAKLGVVPIFETLRRGGGDRAIGVLTGTLVILPRTALPALDRLATEQGIDPARLRRTALPGAPGHVRIDAGGLAGERLVDLVTTLFCAGAVQVLVGTQALLGEGWDAPAVNSLVLASNTAAFMLSNQMRGRAIRVDPAAPGKVANIWHLATIDRLPNSLAEAVAARVDWAGLDDGATDGRSELDLMVRRFALFEGIANHGPDRIENGLGRLDLPGPGDVGAANAATIAAAHDRAAIARRWSTALGAVSPRAHVRQTASPNYAPRRLSSFDTLRWLGISATSCAMFAVADALRHVEAYATPATLATGLAGAATLAAFPKLLLAARLWYRNGSLERSLDQVAHVVLASLAHAGLITEADFAATVVEIRHGLAGRSDVILHGCSRATERQVLTALAEVLGPVLNPRYLLVRRSWLGLRRRTDYHAVPGAIGKRKEWAAFFAQLWHRQVGPSKLHFVRTPQGRRLLLRARARSFAAGFQRNVERRSVWT
ncbi:MAG: DEAD/DEAH box helicase family protein [Sphingomonas sp.]|uniref:DEAD/DEAH box helicase family protein n=1 Tax=Sphingomonas sp. TaxID=28214 RepID=UPI00356481FF